MGPNFPEVKRFDLLYRIRDKKCKELFNAFSELQCCKKIQNIYKLFIETNLDVILCGTQNTTILVKSGSNKYLRSPLYKQFVPFVESELKINKVQFK